MRDDRNLYLVIDQGTSAGKAFLFDQQQKTVFTTRIPHKLTRPAPGQVESDPMVILEGCYRLIKDAIDHASDVNRPIALAGISAQRSTFLFWDRQSARPLTPAISWQDTRATREVDQLKAHVFKGFPDRPVNCLDLLECKVHSMAPRSIRSIIITKLGLRKVNPRPSHVDFGEDRAF